MPHPDEGLIHAWLDGELEPGEALRVEELVATNPEWGAAAAEARGLIAASSRIASALDRVPANVVPTARKASQSRRWWIARVAALLLVVVGTSVVWRRDPTVRSVQTVQAVKQVQPVIRAPTVTQMPSAPTAAMAAVRTPARSTVVSGNTSAKVTAPKQDAKTLADASPVAASPRATTVPGVVAAAENRAVDSRAAPSAWRESVAKSVTGDRCFELRTAPSDSSTIIRFGQAALADSVRTGWTLIADSLLTGPNGQRPLRRVPCRRP
jgi:anti-sigma factor RsiW